MTELNQDPNASITPNNSPASEAHRELAGVLSRVFGETKVKDRSAETLPSIELHPEILHDAIALIGAAPHQVDLLDSISATDLLRYPAELIDRSAVAWHDFYPQTTVNAAGENPRLFLILYQLLSVPRNIFFNLKVILPIEKLEIRSIDDLFGNASWLEREIYDLLGVNFIGARDQRRLMLPDDWVGHPLRRDYQEEQSYQGMSTSRVNPLPGLVQSALALKEQITHSEAGEQ